MGILIENNKTYFWDGLFLELFDIKNPKKGQSPRVRTWPLRKIFTFGMLGISEILKKYASNTDCIKHSLKRLGLRKMNNKLT